MAAQSPAALDLIEEGVNGTVRAATPEALSEGLLELLHPARLPALQDAARHSATQYDLTTRAAALEHVYENVIATKRRVRAP